VREPSLEISPEISRLDIFVHERAIHHAKHVRHDGPASPVEVHQLVGVRASECARQLAASLRGVQPVLDAVLIRSQPI